MTSATVLDLWEAGLSMTPAARGVLLLQAAGESDVEGWPAGARDLALLRRYCAARPLEAVADCLECGTTLEIELDARELGAPAATGQVTVEHDGYVAVVRPPTAGDLASLPPDADVESLRVSLLQRCLVEAGHHETPVSAADLPPELVDAIDDALDQADPAADIRLALTCTECGAAFTGPLDPVSFAWSSVEASARLLATDVHTLARAYGWSEPEILVLSPFRRHLYLSAVGP